MAQRQRPEGEEEGADEALRVRGLRAVDEVRVRRTLMLRRMESLPRRRRRLQARPQHVEPVQPEDLVTISLRDGSVVEGTLRPSSDTPAHLRLYHAFPAIGGVAKGTVTLDEPLLPHVTQRRAHPWVAGE